jgi:hypothetical protein
MKYLILLLASMNIHAATAQQTCLASVIWHESRSQPVSAQLDIVTAVTLNRASDRLVDGHSRSGSRVNPKLLNVCKVIHERGQYQWVKRQPLVPHKDMESWEQSLKLAGEILRQRYYVVGSRRYFNNRTLGILHKTNTKPLAIASMVAY